MGLLGSLALEIVSELIVLGSVSLYLLYQRKAQEVKLRKLQQELNLEKLNNSIEDEVLLIHSMKDLTTTEGTHRFNEASVVLLRGEDGMYNTVIKNKYGDSGTISNKK